MLQSNHREDQKLKPYFMQRVNSWCLKVTFNHGGLNRIQTGWVSPNPPSLIATTHMADPVYGCVWLWLLTQHSLVRTGLSSLCWASSCFLAINLLTFFGASIFFSQTWVTQLDLYMSALERLRLNQTWQPCERIKPELYAVLLDHRVHFVFGTMSCSYASSPIFQSTNVLW